jgi:hypothetical protein
MIPYSFRPNTDAITGVTINDLPPRVTSSGVALPAGWRIFPWRVDIITGRRMIFGGITHHNHGGGPMPIFQITVNLNGPRRRKRPSRSAGVVYGGLRTDLHQTPLGIWTNAPVLPAPVLPAPVLPAPVLPAPVLPVPVLPAPVLPAPVLRNGVRIRKSVPAPVLPAPVLPAPVVVLPSLDECKQTVVDYYSCKQCNCNVDRDRMLVARGRLEEARMLSAVYIGLGTQIIQRCETCSRKRMRTS